MKKLLTITIFTLAVMFYAFTSTLAEAKNGKVQMLPVMSEETKQPDTLWVGTFQLLP